MDKIKKLFDEQKKNLINSPFKDCRNRIKALKLLKLNILEMKDEIFAALKKDLNKSEEESYMAEVGLVLSEISYMIKHCKKFSKPKKVRTPLSHFPSTSYRIPCAYGSVLIISPWNYPFMLSIEPMVDAICAGNSVVLKPSSRSAHVTEVIDKLIKKTFDAKQVFVVKGDASGSDFLLDLDFDYIFYTGSTRIGEIVMKKAAEHFTPVTLEMGGKSPCIVDETANLELSARRIVFGKFLNSGQTCVSPDYLYCHESVKHKLIHEIKKQIILQYTTDPIRNDKYPKMINERQFDESLKLITKDNLIFGGKNDRMKLKIEPTLISATFDSPAMKDEIFGPVLPIVTFKSVNEVVVNVNRMSKPLALYLFSNNKATQDKILSNCDFGGGCVNDTIMQIASPYLGFGGIKQSGLGAYHGKVGFDTFTHYKSVLKNKNWIDLPMRYQPFNKFKYWLIKLFLR